jgi:hypothetical protein
MAMIAIPTLFLLFQLRDDRKADGERYVVPLIGSFVVESPNQWDSEFTGHGPFQLEKITVESLSEWDSYSPNFPYPTTNSSVPPPPGASLFLPNVVKVAIRGNMIAGRTASRYFLLDSDRDQPVVMFYDTEPQFDAALATSGFSTMQLLDPAEMAAKMPPEAIRPWAFRFRGGRWGHSDSWWSALIEGSGLELSLLTGYLLPRGRTPIAKARSRWALVAISVALGWYFYKIAGISSNDVPTLDFAMFVQFPLLFLAAAGWGRGARILLSNPQIPLK